MNTNPNIYAYYGGPDCPQRYGDPLAIERKLRMLLGGDGSGILEQYHSPMPEISLPAAEKFFAAVAYAFGVPPFDPATGQGFMESDLINLWNGFQEWRKKKQPSTASSPTSAPPTDFGPTPNPQLMRSMLDCSGIPAGFMPATRGS